MKCKLLLPLTILWSGALTAAAQSGSIVGTWALTAADKLLPDGARVRDHFGDNPHGITIFTADGHYMVEIYRADHTKFSSGDRLKGTPDEYKDALDGMSVHFGRYTVDPSKHTITFIIDRASFSDWDDTTQVRSYELKGDGLSWKVTLDPTAPSPSPSSAASLFRRKQERRPVKWMWLLG
jgi:hypothetical protein